MSQMLIMWQNNLLGKGKITTFRIIGMAVGSDCLSKFPRLLSNSKTGL